MDWKLAIKEERAALKRLVALLLALADLAERACGRSRAVRAFVLWILRPAETVARNFVTGAPDAPAASMPVSQAGHSSADAMRLAQNFRDLACELEGQSKLAFAVRDETGQAEPLLSGVHRPLDTDGLLSPLRRLLVAPHQAVRATGPPDTS